MELESETDRYNLLSNTLDFSNYYRITILPLEDSKGKPLGWTHLNYCFHLYTVDIITLYNFIREIMYDRQWTDDIDLVDINTDFCFLHLFINDVTRKIPDEFIFTHRYEVIIEVPGYHDQLVPSIEENDANLISMPSVNTLRRSTNPIHARHPQQTYAACQKVKFILQRLFVTLCPDCKQRQGFPMKRNYTYTFVKLPHKNYPNGAIMYPKQTLTYDPERQLDVDALMVRMGLYYREHRKENRVNLLDHRLIAPLDIFCTFISNTQMEQLDPSVFTSIYHPEFYTGNTITLREHVEKTQEFTEGSMRDMNVRFIGY